MYKVTHRELGFVNPTAVPVVEMPRERFLALVDKALASVAVSFESVSTAERVRAEVLPIAETMPHFPVGKWGTERGCGCVVGEYLIAHDILTREEIAEQGDGFNVSAELDRLYWRDPQLGLAMRRFGFNIDDEVVAELENYLTRAPRDYDNLTVVFT